MKTMLRFSRQLLLVPFFLISMYGMAQVTEAWVARFSASDSLFGEQATDLAIDEKGNVYVTGYGRGAKSNTDYTTVKYNTAGVLQWVARYNGPGNGIDEASAVTVDEKGNVYVTGRSEGKGSSSDYATIKYNAAGLQQWVARYNGPGCLEDAAAALLVDEDGNVYVTGSSIGSGSREEDYATIKYGPTGVPKWISRYNGTGDSTDRAQGLALDNKGNVLVTGQSAGSGTGYDYATVKYNSSGVQQWAARFNGTANNFDNGRSVAVDKKGNVYVTGTTYSGFVPDDPFDIPLLDIATVKYNGAGVQQWVDIHDEAGGTDEGNSVIVDKNGYVYVAGDLSNYPAIQDVWEQDYGVIKYNTAGVKLWVAKYGPPPGDVFSDHSLSDQAIDKEGNVYVTGQSDQLEYATVKFDKNGVLQWAITYKNGINNGAAAIEVDKRGYVYVTGNSDLPDCLGCYDFTTIKYSQDDCDKDVPARISQTTDDIPAALARKFQVRVAPNPAASMTKIYYELPVDGRVSIQVFDVVGRQVATLVDAAKQAGFHNTEWDVSQLKSGMYMYRIQVKADNKVWSETGRISVMK